MLANRKEIERPGGPDQAVVVSDEDRVFGFFCGGGKHARHGAVALADAIRCFAVEFLPDHVAGQLHAGKPDDTFMLDLLVADGKRLEIPYGDEKLAQSSFADAHTSGRAKAGRLWHRSKTTGRYQLHDTFGPIAEIDQAEPVRSNESKVAKITGEPAPAPEPDRGGGNPGPMNQIELDAAADAHVLAARGGQAARDATEKGATADQVHASLVDAVRWFAEAGDMLRRLAAVKRPAGE